MSNVGVILDQPDLRYHVLRASLSRHGKTPADLQSDELHEVVRQAQREYQTESRVLAAAEARDVHVPEPVLESAMGTVESRYESHEALLDDLGRNGLSPSLLRAALHRELKVEAVLGRVAARAAAISDLDIRIYYYMHREKFRQPETRTARHILITVNPDFPENTRDAALDRIGLIARRLRRKPHRFGEQATKHSECPTALQGGKLGRLPRGQLYPELDEVLFRLGEGEVSEVVETSVGLHLIYCEKIHAAGPVSLEEAEPRIREKLSERRRHMCQRAWLASLSKEAERAE